MKGAQAKGVQYIYPIFGLDVRVRNKALYFPYINLPDNDWLYLMLLYWDQLSSIVPSEYICNPEELSPHMSTLMREGLVNPVLPQEVLRDLPDFGEPFLGFIRRKIRRPQLKNVVLGQRIPIHIEKLGKVADELVDMRLATTAGYPWFEMDQWVANAFMSYLASLVGSLPEIASVPITNDARCFHLLAGYQGRAFPERMRQRQLILGKIFPFPKADLSLNTIIKFKEKYGNELARFRNKIEGLCIDLSNTPQRDREEQIQIKTRELKDEIDIIANHMHETWHHITFLDILPVLSATGSVIAGSHGNQTLAAGTGLLSLSTAIYRYIERKQEMRFLLKEPLAYGALLNREWQRLR